MVHAVHYRVQLGRRTADPLRRQWLSAQRPRGDSEQETLGAFRWSRNEVWLHDENVVFYTSLFRVPFAFSEG